MKHTCTHTFRKVTTTHNWRNGILRTYWFKCTTCGHTWRTYRDRNTGHEVPDPTHYRALTPEDVHYILTDPSSGTAKARRLGVTHQTVSHVLRGVTHKHLWPDIPRRGALPAAAAPPAATSCRACQHWWDGRCDLSIPEAGSSGFAAECSYFEE